MKAFSLSILAVAVLLSIPSSASALTLKKLHEVKGSGSDYLGWAVAPAGDVDGDGVLDMIAGAQNGSYAVVISGAKGTILYTFTGNSGEGFGYAVGGGGDVNGDGVPDLIVGVPYNYKSEYANVYSGADGQLLYTVNCPRPRQLRVLRLLRGHHRRRRRRRLRRLHRRGAVRV